MDIFHDILGALAPSRLNIFAVTTCLLLTLGAGTACRSEDDNPAEEAAATEELVPIAFTTTLDTRAGGSYVGGTAFAHGAPIGIFAYYTGQTDFGDGSDHTPNFMFDQLATKYFDEWPYSPTKYWPNQSSDKVSFFAYYPHGGTGIALATGNTTAGLPHFDFQTQERTADQVDFMLSDVTADEQHINAERTTSVGYQVPLRFHHALAKVVFRMVDQDDQPLDAWVVTLAGLCDKGTCTPAADGAVNWSGLTQSDPAVTFTTDVNDTPTESIFLLIPQDLTEGDPLLNVPYYIYHDGYFDDFTPIHLNTLDVTEWKSGMTYTYIYKVTHTGTTLSVNVNPWYQAGMVFQNY